MIRYTMRSGDKGAFERPEGMNEVLYRVLLSRGIDSEDAAREYLTPGAHQLLDPNRLHDMQKAAQRVLLAQQRGETVCVYGDYDVDGVSATAILVGFLTERGIDCRPYIPSRHKQGYGLSVGAVEQIAEWAKLIITVDCGITGAVEVARAKELGVDVIVTDHHRPGEALPDCLTVNPLLGDYPFTALCGAGVAWKLVQAIDPEAMIRYIDLAALATVADVVSLTGENRAIVSLGLSAMEERTRPGIAALRQVAGIVEGPITAERIAFLLAPRLNAGGRIGDAMRAYELLMAPSMEVALPIAQALHEENAARRAIETEILREAERALKGEELSRRSAIVLHGERWNVGVIGLAASRLVEKYHMPVILLSREGDQLKGSCRSIPGVDIYDALHHAREHLTRYGGHSQAAGLALEYGALGGFIEAVNAYIRENTDPDAFIPEVEYDVEVGLDQVDLALVEQLKRLEPTGQDNPAPRFLSEARVESARRMGKDGSHLKVLFLDGQAEAEGVWFGQGARANDWPGRRVRFVFSPSRNEYLGRVSLQLMLKEASMEPGELPGENDPQAVFEYLTEILYNQCLYPIGSIDHPDAGWEDLLRWISESPRGTCLVASDVRVARERLAALREAGLQGRLDVFSGRWLQDRRGFNALCILPAGDPGPAYARYVALDGLAARRLSKMDGEIWSLDRRLPKWAADCPEVDALRALYVAIRELNKRPYRAASIRQIADELAKMSGLSCEGVAMGLIALKDIELIRLTENPAAFEIVTGKKANPEESAVYRQLLGLRAESA